MDKCEHRSMPISATTKIGGSLENVSTIAIGGTDENGGNGTHSIDGVFEGPGASNNKPLMIAEDEEGTLT